MKKIKLLFVICLFQLSVVGQSNPVAIPMKYNVLKNKQKFIALSAYSDEITYLSATYNILPIDFGVRYRDAISNWKIETLPDNGTLFADGVEIISVPHSVLNPDELLYIPNTEFVGDDQFQFSVSDNIGVSNLATISIQVDSLVILPKGVPDFPSIFNTVVPIPETSGNIETDDWYIDNTHPNATDSVMAGESNPRHGTPDYPRLTLPPNNSTFVAGAKIFFAGGVSTPYTLRTGVTWHRWYVLGVQDNPVYIIGVNNGVNKPIITGENGQQLRLQMQHAIIEGINIKGIVPVHRIGQPEGNIVFRHCMIDRMNRGTTGAAIAMNRGDDIVYYDLHIKDVGVTEPDLSQENDVHGIQVGRANIWIIDNLIHDCAGDAIQINGEFAQGIYIGRNKLHSDNENAMDFKRRYDLIFVENDIWDYRAIAYASSGSDGVPVLINHDTNGQTPTKSTISRNRIWDANGGVRHQGQNIWTTDNVFWHIHHNSNSTSIKYAIVVGNNGTVGYTDRITNNTFHKVDGGIRIWAGANTNIDHQYKGNNFGKLNDNSLEKLHFRINSNHHNFTFIDYNNYMDSALIEWSGTMRSLSWMQSNTVNCANSMENQNPEFKDAVNFDLSLQSTSPLIDNNIEHIAYQEFFNEYGISITYDANNLIRPQNNVWDIGAYEYQDTDSSVGITEFINNGIFVYPNPTSNTFIVNIENKELKSVVIYNNLGQQVKEVFVNEVDINDLPNGIYIVRIVIMKEELYVTRIVKQ